MGRIVGADLAINHGAICDNKGNVLYSYKAGNGMRSTFKDLYLTGINAGKSIRKGDIISVDWDNRMGSWGNNPKTGILMTVVITSFITYCVQKFQSKIKLISPSEVRTCLGLPVTTSKKDIHTVWSNDIPKSLLSLKNPVKEDAIDAWILTVASSCYNE